MQTINITARNEDQSITVTYEHLLVLADPDSLALDHLQVLQPAQHLVMHLKNSFCAELGSFLDRERLVLQLIQGVRPGEVDGDVGSSRRFDGQRFDDAFPRVFRIADRVASIQPEGGLPFVEGFIVLVWIENVSGGVADSDT